jgi:peptidoglycan L-alanyl-D-glutamate endopeptidase CwlK
MKSKTTLLLPSVTDDTKKKIALLYPGVRAQALEVIDQVYLKTKKRIRVTSSIRSMEEQQDIFRQGRVQKNGEWIISDPKKIITNAKPGSSWHNFGLALDYAWVGMDPYLEKETPARFEELWGTLGYVGKNLGFTWGIKLANGSTDRPHLEMTFGMTLVEAMQAYQVAGLSSVWRALDKMRGVG